MGISYFDTSVLLPALNAEHPIHDTCAELLRRVSEQGSVATTTLHTYAELYTHLTKPTKLDIHLPPAEVVDLLNKQLSRAITWVELSQRDYQAAITRCAKLNLVSAVIYDALHVQAALQVGAEVIYTHNVKDFSRLLGPDDPIRLGELA